MPKNLLAFGRQKRRSWYVFYIKKIRLRTGFPDWKPIAYMSVSGMWSNELSQYIRCLVDPPEGILSKSQFCRESS